MLSRVARAACGLIVCLTCGVLLITSMHLWAAPAKAADYLPAALREQVEALKTQVSSAPTTPGTASERAAVLLDWANAYARSGGYLPVNLTAAARPVLAELPRPGAAAQLDPFVRELTFLDEHPQGLGSLQADSGPFEVRNWVTLRQVYTLGSARLVPGGGILVARHFMPGYDLQASDPAGDNYVSIVSSNPQAVFDVAQAAMSGMHGGFRGSAPTLLFRLSAGELQQGDTVTITYGDRSGRSRGFLMPTMSTDQLPLPLYVDFDGAGDFFSLPIQPVRVRGTQVAGVHGFVPSVVRPGEKFTLSIRAQDRFYNRAKGPIPAWRVTANGRELATVAASDEPIYLVENLRFSEPGVYRIEIQSQAGDVRGVANPLLVSAAATRVFWGDTHGHSGFAEGIGSPERFMTWAKHDARLDFVTHSEHDIWLDDAEWLTLTRNVERFSEPGRFTAFLGYEWTTRLAYGGHHNVLFRTAKGRQRVGTQHYPTLSALYAGLRTLHKPADVIVIPHAHQAGDYRLSDPALEPLVEIMSQHGTFEWFGRMYLKHGHRVGFVAASDNHLSQPGYTAPKGASLTQRGGLAAVLAAKGSRDAIFDAMKGLHTYATSGDRMILDVQLNGASVGARIPFARERKLTGRVIGTAPIQRISVIKNDQLVWQEDHLTQQEGRFGKEETFFVTFASASQPINPGDNPRGGRVWKGQLTVSGAEIVAFEGTDFFAAERNRLQQSADNPHVLYFATATRGDASSIRLRLRGVSRKTQIAIAVDAAREVGGAPPVYRPPAQIPAASVNLRVRDLVKGQAQQTLPIDGYQDAVTLRRLLTDSPSERTFEYVDSSAVQGDYYYVRVQQANDASAWTSPIWVGGHSPR